AAVISVALYIWLSHAQPDGLTGGSQVGLAYGIAGGLLILFAWLLTALRYVPSWWWIGSRTTWLRGHIWMGLLSGVLILCHSGGRFGGPFEQVLYLVLGLTILTGVVGWILQHFLPRLLTQRIAVEVPYDQIPVTCQKLRGEADQLMKKVTSSKVPTDTQQMIGQWYEEVVRPFLGWPARGRGMHDPLKSVEIFGQIR